jgi:hypothetical protein
VKCQYAHRLIVVGEIPLNSAFYHHPLLCPVGAAPIHSQMALSGLEKSLGPL